MAKIQDFFAFVNQLQCDDIFVIIKSMKGGGSFLVRHIHRVWRCRMSLALVEEGDASRAKVREIPITGPLPWSEEPEGRFVGDATPTYAPKHDGPPRLREKSSGKEGFEPVLSPSAKKSNSKGDLKGDPKNAPKGRGDDRGSRGNHGDRGGRGGNPRRGGGKR